MQNITELKEFFSRDRFVENSDIEIIEVNENHAVCRAKIADKHLNANDCVQGGMLFTIADFTMAVLSNALHPVTVTSSATITYIAPCKGAEFIEAESKEVALSRHNCVHDVTVKDNFGNVICVAQINGFIK